MFIFLNVPTRGHLHADSVKWQGVYSICLIIFHYPEVIHLSPSSMQTQNKMNKNLPDLLPHSHPFTALWRFSLEAAAFVGPWRWGVQERRKVSLILGGERRQKPTICWAWKEERKHICEIDLDISIYQDISINLDIYLYLYIWFECSEGQKQFTHFLSTSPP